jgi:hypothetical protein
MSGDTVLGILAVVALSLSGAVVLRLLLGSPAIFNWLADVAFPSLRRRLRRRPFEQPVGRPIQEIASSIRRLGSEFHYGTPGRSWVKSEAIRRSYDGVLVEGCLAMEIVSDLLDLDPGTERDAERMRVEHLLVGAGLILREAG